MDKEINDKGFYEEFWSDADYQQAYAFDSAVRDRYPAIQQVWGDMKLPERVLDFGSGNGVLSYWLHSNGFGKEIFGVDVSNTGVKNANSVFSTKGLKYEHIDKLNDLYGGKKFDAIVSSHVLEHIKSPEKVIAQLLNMSDWFVIEVPLESCVIQDFIYSLNAKKRTDNPLGHVNFWNKSSFRKFLEGNGLMIVKDFQYASAPYSPYNSKLKKLVERGLISVLGLKAYSYLMATHYAVLARRR